MSRRNQMIDPFGDDNKNPTEPRPALSMDEADAALFGELTKRDAGRQVVKPVSIFQVHPDIQQPRRAVPSQVREGWSGDPRDIADLFNAWLQQIDGERKKRRYPPFDLDDYLWAERVSEQQLSEDDLQKNDDLDKPGPIEISFLKVIDLAISIRRDGLANPVTIQRVSHDSYKLETGERRWLAYHILFGYFNGDAGKPQERERWEKIPAIVVDEFNVWRQASENAARADLNAIGRARQFAILMMDLLSKQGTHFEPFETLGKASKSDRAYYAQVIPYRVPTGKGEMLGNGLGVAHRAAFTRCRTLLGLPDEVWLAGDNMDISEDELLRLARLDPEEAIKEVKKLTDFVATRNNSNTDKNTTKSTAPSPTLFDDPALQNGKRIFSRETQFVAKELLNLRDGVGQASAGTKRQIKDKIEELRDWLNQLETLITK